MSDPAIIQGALVNVRNVGTHKSVALTIHVPEELGQRIIELFGWPTMVKPVPVFVARQEIGGGKSDSPPPVDAGEDHSSRASPVVPRNRCYRELPVASQIAITCSSELFWQWLRVTCGVPIHDAAAAEEWVLHVAEAERKRDVSPTCWAQTHAEFERWVSQLGMPKP